MKRLVRQQDGLAHLGLIIFGVIVLGVVGFAGFRIYQLNSTPDDEYNTELVDVDTADSAADMDIDDSQAELNEIASKTEVNDEN